MEKEGLVTRIREYITKAPEDNRFVARLRNRFAADGIPYWAGNLIGGTMAVGAITSDKQSWRSYFADGIMGVVSIPSKIANSVSQSLKVAKASGEVAEEVGNVRNNLEGIVGFLEKNDGILDRTQMITEFGKGDNLRKKMDTLEGSVDQLGEVIQKHGLTATEYGGDQLNHLSQLFMNGVNNLADDTGRVALVSTLFALTGLGIGYGLTRVYRKIPIIKKMAGPHPTTLGEDVIYGSKMLIGQLLSHARNIAFGYALAKESAYETFGNIPRNIQSRIARVKEATNTIGETSAQYFKDLLERVSVSVKKVSSEISNRYKGEQANTVEEFDATTMGDIADSIKEAFQELKDFNFVVDRLTTQLDAAREPNLWSQYTDFLRRAFGESPQWMAQQYGHIDKLRDMTPDERQNALMEHAPAITEAGREAMAHVGTNLYLEHVEAGLLYATLLATTALATTAYGMILNTMHDRKYHTPPKPEDPMPQPPYES